MNVAIIGTGYVGLVTGTCLADFGHTVTCVDAADARIATLLAGEIPFYEPGLRELVQKNTGAGRLRFTKDLGAAVREATVIFLAVGTPETPTGEADLSQVERVAIEMGAHLNGYKVIVTKSTVPVGTGAWLRELLQRRAGSQAAFDVVSNPEFLREGSAVNDFLRPDRVVIGTSSERAAGVMREIYRPLYLIEAPIVITDVESAEMIKYASNAFLAVKIGFMNSIANLCDAVGADVHVVAKGMGLDKRIGSKFLHPGPGYGGSCFPKDSLALKQLAANSGYHFQLLNAVIEVNELQKRRVVGKLQQRLGDLRGKTVALLGIAFKPNTDDVREAPSLVLAGRLIAEGAHVRAWDPIATVDDAYGVDQVDAIQDAIAGVDAVVLVTEWPELAEVDWAKAAIATGSDRPVLVDGRNMLDPGHMRASGWVYESIGRPAA